MVAATYFVQGCPICGRNLQIRLEYLGRNVACQHCHGQFSAMDPAMQPVDLWDSGDDLLARADELLATANTRSRIS